VDLKKFLTINKTLGFPRVSYSNMFIKKYTKWIVLGVILAYSIVIELYKGEGKLPWALIFAGIVVFFVYSFWRKS